MPIGDYSRLIYGRSRINLIFGITGFSPAPLTEFSTWLQEEYSDSINIVLSLPVRAYEVAGKIYYGCSLPLVVVMKYFTPAFPFAKAMDVITQVLFLIILASFTNGKLENADLQNIVSQLKVTHYDS